MENETIYWINIVESDLTKIKNFSQWAEEKYPESILTGLSLVALKDGTYLFGLAFDDEKIGKNVLLIAKRKNFTKVYTGEEDWISILDMTKKGLLGNFSYRLLPELFE